MTCGGVLALSACSLLAPPAASTSTPAAPAPVAPTASAGPSPTTTQSATPSAAATATTTSPAAAPTKVATLSGGNGSALALVIPAAGLAAGWRDTEPRDTGGYRMSVCGVDLEPVNPVDGAQKRWQASAAGPFVEQHVRVYADGTARGVVAALKKAIPRCRSYEATDAQGGSSSYTVSQLALRGVGNQTVAWRQRVAVPAATPAPSAAATTRAGATPAATPAAPPAAPTTPSTAGSVAPAPVVVQDVAVTRRGTSIVLVSSYAVNAVPQADVLARAVRAIPGR